MSVCSTPTDLNAQEEMSSTAPPIKRLVAEVSAWCKIASDVLADRSWIDSQADSAELVLRARVVSIEGSGGNWRVLLIRDRDAATLAAVARRESLPRISEADAELLRMLVEEVSRACNDARNASGVRRLFRSKAAKSSADAAARFLADFAAWAGATDLAKQLASIDHRQQEVAAPALGAALAESVGLKRRLSDLGVPSLWSVSAVSHLPASVRSVTNALQMEDSLRLAAIDAGEAVRSAETDRMVAEMPVEQLRHATGERLRINALLDAGIDNVLGVIQNGWRLLDVPGVGQTTGNSMLGAAHMIRQATYDEMPIRIDVSRRSAETETLLQRLTSWATVRVIKTAQAEISQLRTLTPLADAIESDARHVVVFAASSPTKALENSLSTVSELAAKANEALTPTATDPWDEFLARPAEYFSMLQELGFNAEDEEKTHGELPEEVVEAIRSFELDTRLLTVSPRGYQHFGARFALVQKKVVIGDEMGLGKTIEALAAICHIAAKGSKHSLVVCPAAVVTNWMREVDSKTKLRAHRLHGSDRRSSLRSWIRGGGVAVTTYESLGWFEGEDLDVDIACAVFDEAHYIKNPSAYRSMRSARLIKDIDRAILLTGTPLENRVEEFRNLVNYLRPDLTVDASEFSPRRFRQQVAPAYLRRNQEDVLSELPELVEVDEWLDMSDADYRAYRDAVEAGSFHDMRQAAMLQGEASSKVQRLIELVDEAEQNGRRVLVFSHYRNVLDQVCAMLPGEVIGPLTGSVPALRRQRMVDEFSAAREGAVLVAQIQAGGVGLNIQSASVIVICEPQLKPTVEWQAIARAHRMGQPQSVQVHRLLTDPGVDARIKGILARKAALFEEFARGSDIADNAPEAFDVSEAELVREVVAEERKRLFSGASPVIQ